MDGILLIFLGPLTNWVLAITLVAVVLARHSIRKRHIVTLVVISALGFIAFFTILIWGFTWSEANRFALLYQGVLRGLAGLVVACSSAVGFSFILKKLGFASLEDR